jgi:hypothetical protein
MFARVHGIGEITEGVADSAAYHEAGLGVQGCG